MKRIAIIILRVLTLTDCLGQSTDTYEPFKSSDYPSGKYQIKLDTATFSKFKIEIRQVKTIDNSKSGNTSFYCRGWLTVKQDDKILIQQFFKSIEPVGGCSGLFIPEAQPRKDYFIFSKFGDYDGSIFIIDMTGKLMQKRGGVFYISEDKRYLFTNYDSDAAGLTVCDLNKNLILYSIEEEIPNYLGAWYFINGKYVARAYDDNEDAEAQQIKVATFDFRENKLVTTTVDKDILKSENRLTVYNDYHYAKDCNCGH